MIAIKEDKLNKYTEAIASRHEDRIRRVMEITDQEVMEQLGAEEPEEISPDVLYDHFQSKPSSFYALTGFQLKEFDMLWDHLASVFTVQTKGRKPKISPRDIVIIVLHYLRRYPRIEEMAAIFSLNPSTLQSIIDKYIPKFAAVMKRDFIDAAAQADLAYDQKFPNAPYVVDATVQEIYKPLSGVGEAFDSAKPFFSGKHYFYCIKSQVIVTVKGLAVSIITEIPGATNDKKVFDDHDDELQELFKLHPNSPHMILADKGYQDSNSDIIISPFKGKTSDLTREKLVFNQKLGEVRIIVENFFGRLKSRYEIMSSIYRCSHDHYTNIFILCCALVNFEQIECDHPLRNDDMRFYQRLQASIKQKKKEKEEKAKAKRIHQARLRRRIFGLDEEEHNEEDSDA